MASENVTVAIAIAQEAVAMDTKGDYAGAVEKYAEAVRRIASELPSAPHEQQVRWRDGVCGGGEEEEEIRLLWSMFGGKRRNGWGGGGRKRARSTLSSLSLFSFSPHTKRTARSAQTVC